MATAQARWRFPLGDYGEIKGINDAGVETFTSDTIRSLVRESIQNSLDAATGDCVHVEFKQLSVGIDTIPAFYQLEKVISMCKTRGADKSPAARDFFTEAMKLTHRKTVDIMRISDYGTTGLRGSDTCKTGTDWSRLIKESGSSSKAGTSGGSFGIGKYATFACSGFRTVFFSSMDDAGLESHIGVARLISYEDPKSDQHTTGIGYYSDQEKNVAIRGQLVLGKTAPRTKDEPGTDVYILGFKSRKNIDKEIIKYVLSNFLVSIWKEKLTVIVNDREVNARNLGKYVSELNEYDNDPLVKETIEHFGLLTQTGAPVHVIEFNPNDLRKPQENNKFRWPKGSCTLYLKQGDESLNREVTITRAAGMRLFNQNRISGSIQFTGILMIEGKKMNEDFKAMEAPSHDEWSPERSSDSKLASKMIKALRMWVKDRVDETFKVEIEDEVEAFGTALYLPLMDPTDAGTEFLEEEPLVSSNIEVKKKDITPQNEDRIVTVRVGVSPDPDGDAIRKGRGHAKGSKAVKGSAPGDDEGFMRVKVNQRLVCSNRKKNEYRLSFVVPHDARKARVRLCIQGEVGEEYVEVASAKSNIGSSQGTSCEGNAIFIDDVHEGEKAVITFTTDFPHYAMMGADYYATK